MENYLLIAKESSIPNSGDGVYAKTFIKKGTAVCKYKGMQVSTDQFNALTQDEIDRANMLKTDIFIIGKNIGSKINDNIIWEEYTSVEGLNYFMKKELKRYPNKTINCKFDTDGKKIRIITTKDINEGEELFISYGFKYWLPRLANAGKCPGLTPQLAITLGIIRSDEAF